MLSFKYIYDFGDHWEHRIRVKKKLLGDPKLSRRTMCVAPPEDVGDAPGYVEFVCTIANPNHLERQQILE